MIDSTDPSVHRQRERRLIEHVQSVLDDDRLRIDTTRGRRPVRIAMRSVVRADRAVELKRLMAEMGKPDRQLEGQMPVGETLEVTLQKRAWFILRQPIGRLKVVCVSPQRELLAGSPIKPMNTREVTKVLSEIPPPLHHVPQTIAVLSTSGFTLEAHELAARSADRTVILVEPNDAGGFSVTGPAEVKPLVDLLDPEGESQKRNRIRSAIEESKLEMLSGGVVADRLANKCQLPVQMVEAELKSYARENAGLAARRLDGRIVLFREGSAPTAAGASSAGSAGGSNMAFLDKIRSLFSRKGETEKKIAFLSERRAALAQQRDRGYEDLGTFEQQENKLREEFKAASGMLTKKRIASQLLQIRKDSERRHQLLAVLNQQVNVVNTHLHNLELVQQGQVAKLPDSEELTADAVAAEEMLAQLEADNELASSVSATSGAGSLNAEEQAIFEELERDAKGPAEAAPAPARAATPPLVTPPMREQTRAPASPAKTPQRNEPELG